MPEELANSAEALTPDDKLDAEPIESGGTVRHDPVISIA